MIWLLRLAITDRFAGVLQQIGDGPANHRGIRINPKRFFGQIQCEFHIWLPAFLQQNRPAKKVTKIRWAAIWFWHARELRKLIHNSAQLIGLAHNDIGHTFQLV